jgi:Protein of unknown function (DUF2490)
MNRRRFTRAGRQGSIGAMGVLLVVLLAPAASAQDQLQACGDFDLKRVKSDQLTLGLQVEPKVLVSKSSKDPGWATVDVTPSLELTRGKWVDVLGQVLIARTKQTDNVDSTEFTPRLGFRFHLLSNLRDAVFKERQPARRLVLRNLVRFEWRNLYYSTDKPNSSTLRIRDRFEVEFPINRDRVTDDGAVYAMSDAEWFSTASNAPNERYASKRRVRAGVGQRFSRAWRVEGLYIWDESRDSIDSGFTTSDNVIQVTIRRVW